MLKLELISVSTEEVKTAKKEFDSLVALISPQVKEETKDGITTVKVSTGSLCLNEKAAKVLGLSKDDTITISESKSGLIVYKSTYFKFGDNMKKKLTKSNLLRISAKNFNRIYADNGLNKTEAWFFKLEECIIDLPEVNDVKVYLFVPLEKRA